MFLLQSAEIPFVHALRPVRCGSGTVGAPPLRGAYFAPFPFQHLALTPALAAGERLVQRELARAPAAVVAGTGLGVGAAVVGAVVLVLAAAPLALSASSKLEPGIAPISGSDSALSTAV